MAALPNSYPWLPLTSGIKFQTEGMSQEALGFSGFLMNYKSSQAKFEDRLLCEAPWSTFLLLPTDFGLPLETPRTPQLYSFINSSLIGAALALSSTDSENLQGRGFVYLCSLAPSPEPGGQVD